MIVIGAGPAGVIAAATAAKNGHRVTIYDKNKFPLRKLMITGKGRCNITNDSDPEELITQVIHNPHFLYSAFYQFPVSSILDILHEQGVETKVERGGRIFPVSDKARDVADALVRYAKSFGVSFRMQTEVTGLLIKDDVVTGVKLKDSGLSLADRVIIATGGCTYPVTGSTGDGYRFAEACGHKIIPPKPALVPIVTEEEWVRELQGLSLRNVTLTLFDHKKKALFSDMGELLFTHFGMSGPLVLSASSLMENPQEHAYTLSIDLKPALDVEMLDRRLCRDFEKESRKTFSNALDGLLPRALIPVFVRLSGVDPEQRVHQITREQRHCLVQLLKNFTLTPKAFRPMAEGIVTSGGVSVKEVNPSTMESKKINHLFFAGELLDLDAFTGGYNLQIAFSTGYLAGISL